MTNSYTARFFGVLFGSVVLLSALSAHADAAQIDPEGRPVVQEERSSEGHSVLHVIALYVPNRILDLFDIFRLRLRVGPGLAVGVRATEVAQVYAGTYASAYAGLPGPRLRRAPKLPVGLESHNGASLSVVDATVDGRVGPDYSPTEFGLGTQLGIIGFDFGIDLLEIADFAAGFLTFDIRDDDF